MRNKKNYILFFLIFIIFSTYLPNNSLKNNFFSINDIILFESGSNNLKILDSEFEFLKGKNITTISQADFKNIIEKYPLIEAIKIKKIYPNKIEVNIELKDILGVLIDKKEKKLITANNEILYYKKEYIFEKLPFIYGGSQDFYKLYKLLKEIKFPINEIKTYYYFEINRWDLKLQNDKTIKLPSENIKISLLNFMENYELKNFDKFKIFDYRIKDELILK